MTERLTEMRQALEDIAARRGVCSVCGKLANMPGNYVDCDEGRRCTWAPRDPEEVARLALETSPATLTPAAGD